MDKLIEPPFLRTENNYDRNHASRETALDCRDPSRTQQQFVEETDINYIAEKFHLTGEMPQITGPMWGGDYVGTFDFQAAQNQLVAAREEFMTLPAKTRARFDNDPAKLIRFLEDPENRPEAELLGLVNKPQDTLRSSQGDPAPTGKGDTLSPEPKGAGEPPKTPKTDT